MKKIIALFLLFFAASCVETVVVGSFTAASIATREKSVNSTFDDVWIAAQIDKDFLMNGLKGISNSVTVSVNEGRVLLTGVIRDVEKGRFAIETVWKTKGVTEVIDEIEIDKNNIGYRDFGSPLIDSYITSAIKIKLFFHQQIFPSNYKVVTFNRVVYLIGVYREGEDLKELLQVASKISGVKKVVNHVISVNDSRRKQ